ncbi:sigma-70 family RNA polymerase sigma factor [bacterium 1xD8-48]|nr:sigma-70 family RNA polymerase sigma factor [bacterium 1xD8-48]
MKITYEFVTGEISEAEVDERLGGMLLDLNRQQENNDRKETRRHFSLDGMDYEGELFASAEDTERAVEHREEMARLYSAMEALSPSQRELVEKVYFEERKIAYFKINQLDIELYTDLKNPDLEETIEAVLLKYGIFYGKSETWIESEKLYEMEV